MATTAMESTPTKVQSRMKKPDVSPPRLVSYLLGSSPPVPPASGPGGPTHHRRWFRCAAPPSLRARRVQRSGSWSRVATRAPSAARSPARAACGAHERSPPARRRPHRCCPRRRKHLTTLRRQALLRSANYFCGLSCSSPLPIVEVLFGLPLCRGSAQGCPGCVHALARRSCGPRPAATAVVFHLRPLGRTPRLLVCRCVVDDDRGEPRESVSPCSEGFLVYLCRNPEIRLNGARAVSVGVGGPSTSRSPDLRGVDVAGDVSGYEDAPTDPPIGAHGIG